MWARLWEGDPQAPPLIVLDVAQPRWEDPQIRPQNCMVVNPKQLT